MAVINELIRTEFDKTLSFGNYELEDKTKLQDYEFEGDLYKIKTYKDITKLERNGMFVYESVPGSTVLNYRSDDEVVSFTVEAPQDVQITVELEPEKEYKVFIDNTNVGRMKTNLGGKLNISVELGQNISAKVLIERI